MERWFSNKGQLVQLLVGILGVLIAFVNAWPAIKELQFLTWAPILFYSIITLFAASLILSASRSDATTRKPLEAKSDVTLDELFSTKPEEVLALRGGRTSVTLRRGDLWRSGNGINEMKITFHGSDGDRAELEIDAFIDFVGGSLTAKKGDHILLPNIKEGKLKSAAHLFSFSREGFFLVDIVGVEHLNLHTQEVTLFIIRCRAYGPAKAKSAAYGE